jgi:putative SOS response-associated peptidase YedK
MGELQTVNKAPSFRKVFAKLRCLIPADGFYRFKEERMHLLINEPDEEAWSLALPLGQNLFSTGLL